RDSYVQSVISNMTAKSLVVFCFYALVYKHINIAKELKITEVASKKGLKRLMRISIKDWVPSIYSEINVLRQV
ncbi:conjugal transfer protein TraJ, partial [Escherichia coli]